MDINEKSIKKWSVIGARPTFGLTLLDIAKEREDLIVLTADVSSSAGLERFRKQCQEQYLDVGIAEQNMMGIAAGLAKEGFHVITTTFAPFQSMRCLEQIRVNQGYMQIPLVMVGLASGVYHSYLGNTHCCIEDCSILRAIPNLSIVTPADGVSVVKVVTAAVDYHKPVYIRLMDSVPMPVVYTEDYDFAIGKANVICEGNDLVFLAAGTMVQQAMKAAELLKEEGISCKVVDFHTIKPLDTELLESMCEYKYIFTIEEHTTIGGLGSAISEYYAGKKERPSVIMMGINDFYPHGSEYEQILEMCGLTSKQIAEKVKKYLED